MFAYLVIYGNYVCRCTCREDGTIIIYIYITLWKRFIDDGIGIMRGSINDFLEFYNKLQGVFYKYGLELTCDTDSHKIEDDNIVEKQVKGIQFLDMVIFKADDLQQRT